LVSAACDGFGVDYTDEYLYWNFIANGRRGTSLFLQLYALGARSSGNAASSGHGSNSRPKTPSEPSDP